jgi:hypothetical protein
VCVFIQAAQLLAMETVRRSFSLNFGSLLKKVDKIDSPLNIAKNLEKKSNGDANVRFLISDIPYLFC